MSVFDPVARLLERLPEPGRRRAGVAVQWHDTWTRDVSDAYHALNGQEWLPEDLLRDLANDQSIHKKRVAVLTRHGEPWALVPLRLAGAFWDPVVQGVLQGYDRFLCHKEHGAVLRQLGLAVATWDAYEPPDGVEGVRWATSFPSYDLRLDTDPHLYWRASGHWKSITAARKRTAGFELVLDDPAAATWAIERWRDKWDAGNRGSVSSKWRDRLIAARWGLGRGMVRSWALRDGDRWVAGKVATRKDARLVFATIYRDPEYDWYAPATRINYEAFVWAYQAGLKEASLGPEFGYYKHWWAPPAGTHWNYVVSPLQVHLFQGGVERSRRLINRRRSSR